MASGWLVRRCQIGQVAASQDHVIKQLGSIRDSIEERSRSSCSQGARGDLPGRFPKLSLRSCFPKEPLCSKARIPI